MNRSISIRSHALRIAAVLLLSSATIAHALVTPFASRATFDAAFPGSIRQNWDGFAAGTSFPDGTTSGGITYSTTGADAVVSSGFITSSGPNVLGAGALQFFEASNNPTFLFSAPLSAFGIDFNTFATAAGAYTATTNLGDVITSVFDPCPGEATGQFLGFSSTIAFASITISAPSGTPYNLDTLRAVNASPAGTVPEPGSLALLGAALGAFGLSRRREKL